MNKLFNEIPRALIISISIFLVLTIQQYLTGNDIVFTNDLLVNFGYTMLYSLSLYFSNAGLFIYLDKIFSVERFTQKRLLIGFIASFFLSILVIFLLRIFEDVIIGGISMRKFLNEEQLSNYFVAVILTFVVTLAFHAFYYYKTTQENKVKVQKVIAGTASAQFESLKNQIDPHFLFNSLNVLSSLIEENPENAQKFTTALSKIYRYVLEQKDKELVSVEEELNFAKTYMNLLKMRFENSITFELPENDLMSKLTKVEAKVVPLSLQLLLENTIKHNVASEQKPLQIRIYFQDDYLIVENNFQKKEVLQSRNGVGLQNIVNRYAILTDRKVMVEETPRHFNVKIPVLTKQITLMETTNQNSENQAYLKAQKRVKELKEFYSNLTSYLIIIPFLILINIRTSPQFYWFWFPMLGWGVGLAFHAFGTFGYGKNWEDKKIQEILNKENKRKWN